MIAHLPDGTRLSQVHLCTASLDRALEFYCGVLGLCATLKPGRSAMLSAMERGPTLIVLTERNGPGAVSKRRRSGALHHFAIWDRRRQELAQALQGLHRTSDPSTGAAGHGLGEVICLNDPDGNGIEWCADWSGAVQPGLGSKVGMETERLDPNRPGSMLRNDSPEIETYPQVGLGYIHLYVTDLGAAERFYSQFLGLAVTGHSGSGPLCFSPGGSSHYRIAVSLWGGRSTLGAGGAGVHSYRLEVPCPEVLYCLSHRAPLLGYESQTLMEGSNRPILQVRDLNGNWLEVQAGLGREFQPAAALVPPQKKRVRPIRPMTPFSPAFG